MNMNKGITWATAALVATAGMTTALAGCATATDDTRAGLTAKANDMLTIMKTGDALAAITAAGCHTTSDEVSGWALYGSALKPTIVAAAKDAKIGPVTVTHGTGTVTVVGASGSTGKATNWTYTNGAWTMNDADCNANSGS